MNKIARTVFRPEAAEKAADFPTRTNPDVLLCIGVGRSGAKANDQSRAAVKGIVHAREGTGLAAKGHCVAVYSCFSGPCIWAGRPLPAPRLLRMVCPLSGTK